jgi:response regulator NasT
MCEFMRDAGPRPGHAACIRGQALSADAVLKVLLVDTDAERTRLMEANLAPIGATSIVRLLPGEPLSDGVRRLEPDIVIVDMARPDRDALDGVRQLATTDPRPVVMFVDDDDPAFMEAGVGAGVSSYVVVREDLPDVKPIVQTAVALFRRYRQLEQELERARSSLHERTLLDRAKATLMRTRKMTETEAHHWLRRQAMQRSRRIGEIAAEILAGAEPSERRNAR